ESAGRAAAQVRDALAAQGKSIAVACDDEHRRAAVEDDVVQRILAPLLDNAVRFARSRVELAVRGADGFVVFEVSDDGPGLVPAEQVEGLYSCLDYYRDAQDPFSRELLDRYDKRYPGGAMFTGGGACSGMFRGMRLWEAAVREAGSLDEDEVVGALDHAKI